MTITKRGLRLFLTAAVLIPWLATGQAPIQSSGVAQSNGTTIQADREQKHYPDGRPSPRFHLPVRDAAVVLRHGSSPGGCDELGARDVWVWEHAGTYYMHYDGAGPRGWLTCLASSSNLTQWTVSGPVLDLGKPGEQDSGSASYGITFHDGRKWHLFYMGTPHTSPAPERIPAFPYLTMKAESSSPTGPWRKRYEITPFRPQPGTYCSATASPGQVLPLEGEYWMFFSASTDNPTARTIGLARTRDLDGPWTVDDKPILPPAEQVENTSIYHQESTGTWFLFTNHVGLKDGLESTDAIWVYWSADPARWNPEHKAVVLDGETCDWSKQIIGLPSVVQVGGRLALFFDGYPGKGIPAGVQSHMRRDIGLAWLDLPLVIPGTSSK